jgi:hypothetical protein
MPVGVKLEHAGDPSACLSGGSYLLQHTCDPSACVSGDPIACLSGDPIACLSEIKALTFRLFCKFRPITEGAAGCPPSLGHYHAQLGIHLQSTRQAC